MVKNRKLSKSISDLGWFEFRRQLEYKTDVAVIDRWFPSSKTCSNCGSIKDTLSLSERIYKCDICGFEIDRDLNASLNIKQIGTASSELTSVDMGALGSRLHTVETTVGEAETKLAYICTH